MCVETYTKDSSSLCYGVFSYSNGMFSANSNLLFISVARCIFWSRVTHNSPWWAYQRILLVTTMHILRSRVWRINFMLLEIEILLGVCGFEVNFTDNLAVFRISRNDGIRCVKEPLSILLKSSYYCESTPGYIYIYIYMHVNVNTYSHIYVYIQVYGCR